MTTRDATVLDFVRHAVDLWDQFWFTPRTVETLAGLRIFTGAMLLYSHVVLASDLSAFLGPDALIDNATSKALQDGSYAPATAVWSSLWFIDSSSGLWLHHGFTIGVTLAFTIGLLTRITGVLAVIAQWMLLHRLFGALFGLDQIVTYSAMYLAITPCGAVWSVDAWWRNRQTSPDENRSRWKRFLFPDDIESTSATIGTRLLQIHLCVIYLFGGLAKSRGQMWWDGTALWYAVSNYEYQSFDLTFLSPYPVLFTGLTHVTLLWEIFYVALVWPKITRWFAVGLAVAVHGGIATFLGMATFGLMMIAANAIFLSPVWIRKWRLQNQDASHPVKVKRPKVR
ncbi:MAG: HTTM domain-containing protein [Planctomycetota bacterium]